MSEKLKTDVRLIEKDLIRWRRDFHRYPEIANLETRTSSVIRLLLENLGVQVRACAGTGLIGTLEGLPGGRTIALRADMDALPLIEEGDKEYISLNQGACHACGHDGHMAILMGVASLLAQRKQEFRGRAVFLFQPSEEKIPGGAVRMIAEGALENVDGIFGLHLWQGLPTGTVACRPGPQMAATDEVQITVIGKGGHGSLPQETVDPILAASQLIINLQSIVSRNVDPLKSAVVTIGKISGGTAHNIIPSEVSLLGTIRTFDPLVQGLIEKRVAEIVEGTCGTFGARGVLQYSRGYPALINDEAMSRFVREVAQKTLGETSVIHADPVMGGEDFAYYLHHVPGAFLFFGMGDGTRYPHHHPGFDIDEKSLPKATQLMTQLALDYLV